MAGEQAYPYAFGPAPVAEPCLDVCELVSLGETPAETLGQLGWQLERPELAGAERIYVGSNFCPQALFASTELISASVAFARAAGMQVTLSLPIFAQRFIAEGLDYLDACLRVGEETIDEVTVNDFGMLAHLSLAGYGVGINIGRLLNKDTRDPRDPYYPHMPYVPNSVRKGPDGRSFLQANILAFSSFDQVRGVEFDPTHDALDLSQLDARLTPAVHGPLCYMSTGQICEYASIGRPDAKSYRANDACALQCTRTASRYYGESEVEFYKLGRTVYFDAPDVSVSGVESYRQLHAVLAERRPS